MVFSKCYDRSFFNIAYSGGFKSAAIGLFKFQKRRYRPFLNTDYCGGFKSA